MDDITCNFFHTFNYLKVCGKNGITFKKEKFQFCKKEVEFMNFRVTADGVKHSNYILKDIAEFPEPVTLTEVRRWFSLIKQVAWAYGIGDTMNNFRDLVKPTVKTWTWSATLRDEFQWAKQEIIRRIKEGVMTYNKDLRTCMSTDWSKCGIGFLVTQKHCSCPFEKAPRCCKDGFKIVFAGSKKCLDAESRYAH